MSLLYGDCPAEVHAIVKLQHLLERIMNASRIKERAYYDTQTDLNIQMFLNELHEWRASTPPDLKNMRTSPPPIHPLNPQERALLTPYCSTAHIAIADHFTNITIFSHELGFLRRAYPSSSPPVSFPQTHLTSCLAACKSFFEAVLSIPETLYPHFSIVQYAMVIQAILVLSRLTFLMAAKLNWDAGTARANVPMVMYLDALSYRFLAVSPTPTRSSSGSSETPRHWDWLHIFAVVLESVKRSFVRRVDSIQPVTFLVDPSLARGPHCPMKDASLSAYFDQEMEMEMDSAYGGDLSGSGASTAAMTPCTSGETGRPLYHDLWATMTCTWANEF